MLTIITVAEHRRVDVSFWAHKNYATARMVEIDFPTLIYLSPGPNSQGNGVL